MNYNWNVVNYAHGLDEQVDILKQEDSILDRYESQSPPPGTGNENLGVIQEYTNRMFERSQ